MSKSELERQLDFQLRAAGLEFEREYRAIPGRKFPWDFAFPGVRLLVEIQGGIWTKGGHSTGTGITRDCEKLSLAALNRWYCMAFTDKMIKDGTALNMIEKFLESAK